MNVEEIKSLNLVWLSKTDLANLNAGEGSSNVVELKTYANGQKPYVSGQSVRHALRSAIERENSSVFKCTPEAPCGNIKDCWLCDMFGFLNPKKDEGSDRRWSPVKISPALGQIRKSIVTDLLTRSSQIVKESSNTLDQRMAYVQLAENVYKTGMCLDLVNMGKTVKVSIVKSTVKSKEETDHYDMNEKKKRVKALIKSVWNLSDFAKQARNLASLAPEIVIASMQPEYNHRVQDSVVLDDEGNLDCERLKTVLKDLSDDNADIYVGYTSGVIKNDAQFKKAISELGLTTQTPGEVKQKLLETFK